VPSKSYAASLVEGVVVPYSKARILPLTWSGSGSSRTLGSRTLSRRSSEPRKKPREMERPGAPDNEASPAVAAKATSTEVRRSAGMS
jgi:hypothetical protein